MKNHEIDDAKFIYYRKYIYYLMIIIAFSSAAYYASDCAIFGCVETITVFPRFMVFIPTVLFIVAFKKNLDRRVVINLAYIICHAAIIGTI